MTHLESSYKCPSCHTDLGGKPQESVMRDLTMQSIVDWLIPEFLQAESQGKHKQV